MKKLLISLLIFISLPVSAGEFCNDYYNKETMDALYKNYPEDKLFFASMINDCNNFELLCDDILNRYCWLELQKRNDTMIEFYKEAKAFREMRKEEKEAARKRNIKIMLNVVGGVLKWGLIP